MLQNIIDASALLRAAGNVDIARDVFELSITFKVFSEEWLIKVNYHFDDIVLHILPLLKNGITPEKQTILGVLQDVAIRCEGDC